MSRAPVLLAGLVLTIVAAARSAAQNAAMDPNALEPGVTFRVYHVGYPMDRLYDLLDDQTPNVDERRDVVDWPDQGDFGGFEDHFVVHVRGYLAVDAPGRYEFRLTTDDGSRLMIDGAEIIDHDGLHAATAKTGAAD
ncbi:MAG: hypothetical protein KDA25_08925, partial [Phycisphaerales bacterium]|nr:hypothetical protein [Phycisphaerales bacterium]